MAGLSVGLSGEEQFFSETQAETKQLPSIPEAEAQDACIVVRRIGLGAVFVLSTADANSTSRSNPDCHAREPLHACDTC